MSESEQMGRLRREITAAYESTRYKPSDSGMLVADAIDRLAADVAAVREAVCDRGGWPVGWLIEVHRLNQRRQEAIALADEARAEVERLRAELAARQADGNRQATLDSSPAAPQPAAPPAGWLTQEERRILSAHVQALRDQRRAMERGGQTLGYSANPCGLKREADAIDALLARAGSPPVVEVPELGFLGPMTGREQGIVLAYRDALDAAGVKWKEAGRE